MHIYQTYVQCKENLKKKSLIIKVLRLLFDLQFVPISLHVSANLLSYFIGTYTQFVLVYTDKQIVRSLRSYWLNSYKRKSNTEMELTIKSKRTYRLTPDT